MKSKRKLMYLPIVFSIAACVSGCATTGTFLDPIAVRQIQKGVTTRAEVEAKLNVAMTYNILPDGNRQALYFFTKRTQDGLTYVPFVNYFAGGTISRSQQLQIVYDQNGVVKDYEFTDTSEHSEGGMLNQHGTAVPTSQDDPGKK